MKKNIKRYTNILFYILLFAGIVVATYLIVSDARGYEYDLRTGEVNLKGLLILESTPSSAQLHVDGERKKVTTPDRIELPAETHNIRLTRDGYVPWEKKVRILGEKVTDLTYPRLFPEQINTENLGSTEFSKIQPSYDHRKAVAYRVNGAAFTINNLTGTDFEVLNEFDLTEVTGPNTQIKNVKWSQDNRFILVSVRADNQLSQLYIDTENFEILNLTRRFALPLDDLRFDERNSDNLFWLRNGELRSIDVSSETVSAPLLTNVSQFQQNNQMITYLESGASKDQLAVNTARLTEEITPNRVALVENRKYQLAYRIEENQHIVFLGSSKEPTRIFIIEGEKGQAKERTIDFNSESIVSDHRRSGYILARNKNQFLVFKPETGQTFQYSLQYDSISSLKWLDGAYIGGIADGKAITFEFDGKNLREFTEAKEFVRNDEFSVLYSINDTQLRTSQLILQQSSGGLPF